MGSPVVGAREPPLSDNALPARHSMFADGIAAAEHCFVRPPRRMEPMEKARSVSKGAKRGAVDADLFAVAIGASTGGVAALLDLVGAMPSPFPAVVLVVQHIGAHPNLLPELMRARGCERAVNPSQDDALVPGTIYIAPPDVHMMIGNGRIHLLQGPKENHCRPAIDPLFRSAALAFGARAIGVVLTGHLDDGTAGLRAIKQCGGTTIVQDPATAVEPGMPQSALDNVEIDYCVPLDEIVPTLLRLVTSPGGAVHAASRTGSARPSAPRAADDSWGPGGRAPTGHDAPA